MTQTPLYVRMVDAPGMFSVSDDTLRAYHVTWRAAEVVQLRRG